MNSALVILAAGQPQGSMLPSLGMLVIMGLIFYFFIIRPQQKQKKETENARNSLTVGSEVITAGGIIGKVKHLNPGESYMSIEIASNVVIKVDRNSVFAKGSADAQQR